MTASWQELVADKRRRQAEAIPKEWLITVPPDSVLDVTNVPDSCGLLSPRELEITNTIDVATILGNLATAKWSAVEVTTAFYKRAIIAQQLVNCLTEIFVERALARAKELDRILKETGEVVGPLHGLPVSLKDQICIQGLETTTGYVSWIGKYAEKNAVLTDILYEAGAVPFVRTNVPQTLMWSETNNKIFGRTLNPFNRKLTCGGSSGGEGALIGMRGSPLGVGSDIGGSIRIPSAFEGLYGLRPSYGRVPYAGAVNTLEGQDSILSVLGPMSNSISGVKLFMQAVAASKPWLRDPLARRAPWNDAEYALSEHGGGKQLCFAIMWNSGVVVPHPPIIRAMQTAKAALLAAGHCVIDWEPYKHAEIYDLTSRIWTAASDEDYSAVTSLTGEPLISTMELVPETETAEENVFLPAQKNVSAYQLWQYQKAKTALRHEYLDKWNETVKITGTGRPVDAIIAPAAAYVAPPHGKNYSAEYTAVWNALDYVACVFPVTKVDPVLDAKKPPHEFLNATDKKNYEFYDPETFWNAPVALQLVGRSQEEEAVIAMVEIVDAALKGDVAPKL